MGSPVHRRIGMLGVDLYVWALGFFAAVVLVGPALSRVG